MRRSVLTVGTSIATLIAGASLALVAERDASACGGCFHPPTQTPTDVTDHRMILSVSPEQSTLYDQIEYAGSPSSFAWVLPIHGTVDVGLSADVVFDSLDVMTATQIQAPASTCPPPPNCAFNGPSSGGASVGTGSGSGSGGGVTVTKQQNVGPYATVQLQATDPMALNTWLTANGFNVSAAEQPIIAAYVNEQFNFLAMKLLPNQGIQAMRPVRVTTQGASLALPLRMVAVGTGATVGVTLWVLSDGRYEPQNFPFFHIADTDLIWDWSIQSSNYTTLRAQNEAALGGKGWEIESSLTLQQQLVTGVIESGGQYFGGQGGSGFVPPPSDASQDYLPGTDADGGMETPDQSRTDDMAALFAGVTLPNVRVTRIRSDLAHAALTADLVMQASADQSELSNVRQVTKSVNVECPIYGNDCNIIGYGPGGTGASPPAGGASGASSFACGTAVHDPESPVGLVPIAALLGLAVVHGRRRRSR